MLFSQFATGSYTVNIPKNAVRSLELRELIVKLRNEDKHSIGDIANIVKKSKSVIHGILKKFDETGSCEAKKPPGRPRKTTSREDRFITLQAKKDRFTTAAEIANKIKDNLGVHVSRYKVSRRLNEQRLMARTPSTKPFNYHKRNSLLNTSHGPRINGIVSISVMGQSSICLVLMGGGM